MCSLFNNPSSQIGFDPTDENPSQTQTNVNVKNSVKNTDDVDKIRYIFTPYTETTKLNVKPLLIAII